MVFIALWRLFGRYWRRGRDRYRKRLTKRLDD